MQYGRVQNMRYLSGHCPECRVVSQVGQPSQRLGFNQRVPGHLRAALPAGPGCECTPPAAGRQRLCEQIPARTAANRRRPDIGRSSSPGLGNPGNRNITLASRRCVRRRQASRRDQLTLLRKTFSTQSFLALICESGFLRS
jgi:hypothetical protein